MSWEKGVFSNLMWGAYTLITAVALVETCAAAATALGGTSYLGPVTALVLEALVAGSVFLIHRLSAVDQNAEKSGTNKRRVAEEVFVMLFLGLGLVIRASGIEDIRSGSAFYDAAMVAEGHSIPEIVHGASYLYLQLLHAVFMLVGNKLAAGIWLQVVLQLLAVLLLYLAVRKLAGVFPAVVMLVFFTCMKPVVKGTLTLSPEQFFLFLFAIGLNLVAMCRGKVKKPFLFLLTGIWIGLAGYLDICGFLLLIFVVGAALDKGEPEVSGKVRTVAVVFCLIGMTAGFLGFILADAFICGESFVNVLRAWSVLFSPGETGLALEGLNNGLIWEVPLFLLMFFGVISYWSNREREYMSMWMLVVCLAAIAQYFGVLTEDVPAAMYLALGLTVLAGVGVRASFGERSVAVVRKASKKSAVMEVSPPAAEVKTEGMPIKLPKYLQEPGSTAGIKIPKYMQEEMAAARPAPQAKPAEPKKAEPVTEPVQTEASVQEEAVTRTEAPVQGEAVSRTEAPVQEEAVTRTEAPMQEKAVEQVEAPLQTEPESDFQEMYGVPERFRPQNATVPQEPVSGQAQPEPVIAVEPKKAEPEPAKVEEPEMTVPEPAKVEEPKKAEPEPAKVREPEKAEPASSKSRYIENPLPLPKPHQKKVLDYDTELSIDDDCYDYPVDDDDDFDIK